MISPTLCMPYINIHKEKKMQKKFHQFLCTLNFADIYKKREKTFFFFGILIRDKICIHNVSNIRNRIKCKTLAETELT